MLQYFLPARDGQMAAGAGMRRSSCQARDGQMAAGAGMRRSGMPRRTPEFLRPVDEHPKTLVALRR
ncbi:MAG: hypothetical protein A2521_03480 [Deltaproteobacteria bacterium RIFOXYD12_FULL_57_12]|nr:MAG: hypothetical protein A2521_03480 [Deltaproteobacteria bacterium RIFOXYD12_FULL_57_12]